MIKKFNILFFLLLGLWKSGSYIQAQTYFKISEEPEKYFNQKIERFSNGDILIGDSSLESQRTGTHGKVFMSRLDNCGNKLWAHSYEIPEGYLEFKDFKINEAQEIFVYGSFYRQLSELIFLLKIEGKTGSAKEFQLFFPGSVDHFSYSLDLKDGKVMIYGLLLDFNTKKEGFVAIFNEQLFFLWGKKFTPFESSGAAIISEDNGFFGSSGNYHIKLDETGALHWASILDAGPNIHIVSGPFEVPGGFILEAHQIDFNFFYKLDYQGQLIWKTALFPATENGSAISLLDDGNLLCTYSRPVNKTNQLCQLTISPEGNIFDQRHLFFEQTTNTGTIYQSIDNDNIITIVANKNPFSPQDVDVEDFLLQFSLESESDDCLQWESFVETKPNSTDLKFSFYDFEPESFNMQLVETVKTDTIRFFQPFREICDSTPPDFLRKDTTLNCGEDWLAYLPGHNFIWTDGTQENPRLISEAGIYKARKSSCINPLIVNYTLTKPNCECQVYLPNAFSPNDDGINDALEFFSDCQLKSLEISIFSRWGDLLFHSKSPGFFWNGTLQDEKLPNGVYIAVVKYQWTDLDGKIQHGFLAQDVTLLR